MGWDVVKVGEKGGGGGGGSPTIAKETRKQLQTH